MRKITRGMAFLLALVLMLMCAPFGVFAADGETKTQNGDVVLVIDDTISMERNDPTKMTAAATTIFGSLLSSNAGSNVGVVTFCKDVMEKFEIAPVNADTLTDLQTFAETKIRQDGKWTDIVVGLSEAMNMLTSLPESDNTKAIMVVTDGELDFGGGRTEEISNTELALVKQLAQEKGIRVFIIGLNNDQDAVEDYLEDIADATNGDVEFIDDASEIKPTLTEFYKELGLIDSKGPIPIPVPEEGVNHALEIPENTFETVVTMTHTSPLLVSVTDPGNTVMTEGDYYTLMRSDTTTIIKLREPAAGTYMLHIKNESVPEQNIMLETFLNSEVMVEITVAPTAEAGADFQIQAALVRGGEQYLNADLKNLTAVATLTNGQDTVQVNLPLSGDNFAATTQLTTEGDWNVSVTVQSDRTFKRSSDVPATISITAPIPQKAPIPLWVIILIIAIVVILIVIGLLVFKYISSVPKHDDVPNGSFVIVCKKDNATVWRISLAARRMFRPFSVRKNGCNLMDAVNEYTATTPRKIDIDPGCEELFGSITIRLKSRSRGRGKNAGKTYDFSFVRLKPDGNTSTSSLPAFYEYGNDENTARIEISWI